MNQWRVVHVCGAVITALQYPCRETVLSLLTSPALLNIQCYMQKSIKTNKQTIFAKQQLHKCAFT